MLIYLSPSCIISRGARPCSFSEISIKSCIKPSFGVLRRMPALHLRNPHLGRHLNTQALHCENAENRLWGLRVAFFRSDARHSTGKSDFL